MEIATVDSFEEIINSAAIKPIDRQILRMWYLKGHDFNFIADTLGYSESGIKRKHRKILQKLDKMPFEYFDKISPEP